MSGTISQGSQGVNLAQLISSISPILLGTGKTTGTSDSSGTSSSSGSTTTTKNADPGTLAALLGVAQNASDNAQNPDITKGIVDNIFSQSAEAFAPTQGLAASSGLYNSSTLQLLSNDARARATAQASAAVLNFQTTQQQIASGALSNILGATGTTTTNTTQKAATANTGNTTNITAPSLSGSSLLESALGIGASVLGKKALDSVTPFLKDSFNSVTDALGLSSSGIGSLPSAAQTGAAASDAAMSGVTASGAATLPSAADAVTTNTVSSGVDISNSIGADFSSGPEGLSSSVISGSPASAGDITISGSGGEVAAPLTETAVPEAGSAAALNAPSVDVAASSGQGATPGIQPAIGAETVTPTDATTPGIGTSVNAQGVDTTTGGLEGTVATPGADTAGLDIADLAAQSGGLGDIAGVASGIFDATGLATSAGELTQFGAGAGDFASIGAGTGNFIDAGSFDPTFGGALGDATSLGSDILGGVGSFGVGQLVQEVIPGEAGQIASSALGVGSAVSGAFGGPTIGGTLLAGADAVGGALGAGAVGTEAAAAVGGWLGGSTFATVLESLAAVAAWVVCTELTRQGKIPTKIYRYALRRFKTYNYWGVKGYLTWGLPLKNYVRDNPDTLVTKVIAYAFLKRAHNLALKEGCKDAKWSLTGWFSSVICYWISVAVGVYLAHKHAYYLGRVLTWREISRKWEDTNYLSSWRKVSRKSIKVLNSYSLVRNG